MEEDLSFPDRLEIALVEGSMVLDDIDSSAPLTSRRLGGGTLNESDLARMGEVVGKLLGLAQLADARRSPLVREAAGKLKEAIDAARAHADDPGPVRLASEAAREGLRLAARGFGLSESMLA